MVGLRLSNANRKCVLPGVVASGSVIRFNSAQFNSMLIFFPNLFVLGFLCLTVILNNATCSVLFFSKLFLKLAFTIQLLETDILNDRQGVASIVFGLIVISSMSKEW